MWSAESDGFLKQEKIDPITPPQFYCLSIVFHVLSEGESQSKLVMDRVGDFVPGTVLAQDAKSLLPLE